jgi:hypothetical protein
MTMNDQEEGERAIFKVFAAACPLPIAIESIRSRQPPAPDVLCEVAGQGPVAFELGEVVSEALEQRTNEAVAVRRNFVGAYDALPLQDRQQIEACLGGPPAVFVGFGVSPGKWRQAVRPILAMLVARSRSMEEEERLREGEIPVWRIPELRHLLTDLEIRRCSMGTPFFGALEMSEVVDRTTNLLERKFSKSYQSDAPIELLAYYVGAPPPEEPEWKADTLEFIRARWSQSPFRRVWLFDGFKRAIILVHPDLSSEPVSRPRTG